MNTITSSYHDKPVTVKFTHETTTQRIETTYSNVTEIVVTDNTTILFEGEDNSLRKMVVIIPNKHIINIYNE